jgi:hypothetical protein
MEVVKHISPRAEQLISEYGLGHVRAEYSETFLKRGADFHRAFAGRARHAGIVAANSSCSSADEWGLVAADGQPVLFPDGRKLLFVAGRNWGDSSGGHPLERRKAALSWR